MKTSILEKSKNINRYGGKWVALLEDRVVAHGEKLEEVMKKVKAQKLQKKTSVFLVPRKDEGPYVLMLFL